MSIRHMRAALVLFAFSIAWLATLPPARAGILPMTVSGRSFGAHAAAADQTSVVATATDATGNTYVTGWSSGTTLTVGKDAGGGDVTLHAALGMIYAVKYDPAGRVVWAQLVSGEFGAQMVTSIALDGASPPNVYVSGWYVDATSVFGPGNVTLPLTGDMDMFMMKLSGTDGAMQWVDGFGTAATSYQPTAMAVRADGTRAYVVGCVCAGGAFLARIDMSPAGRSLAVVQPFTGTGFAEVTLDGVAVTASGDVFVAGTIEDGDLATPQVVTPGNTVGLLAAYDANLATLRTLSTFGGAGSGLVRLSAIAADASSLYVTGWMDDGDLTLATTGGPVTLTGMGAGSNGFVFKAGIADQIANPGRVQWAQAFGGPQLSIDTRSVVAVDAAGATYVGALALPTPGDRPDLSNPVLAGVGTGLNLVALRLAPDGTFTDGVAMGADDNFDLAIASGVAAGGLFTLGGTMTVDFTVPAVTMDPSAGSFALLLQTAPTSVPPVPTPPPGPNPPVVIDEPARTVNVPTAGGGVGTISLASSFANPGGLVFAASAVGGGGLPGWLAFDPATATLRYTVPLPDDLPVQPLGDAANVRPNSVYPPLLRLLSVPIVLTGTDHTTGAVYRTVVDMVFHAPRSPVAVSAVSLGPSRVPGDRAAGRSALSYDGGQMIFETAATNLFPQAPSPYGDIVRYHGLSGVRERLSQTAIPGGGVANSAHGPSSSPAVSADGAYAAFTSDAPGISELPSGGERQVYRVSLVYPRVELNQAATPAPLMASATASGIAGNDASDNPSLSGDGRYVAFDSVADNLDADLDGTRTVWRKDFATGEILQVAAGSHPSISWGGRYVALENDGRILIKDVIADTLQDIGEGEAAKLSARGDRVVFVSTSQVVQVDVATGARRVVGTGDQPAMSADGRFVAFRAIGANGFTQIWLRDVDREVTALVTQTAAGGGGNGDSLYPSVSGDGTQVGFVSSANDLVAGKPAGVQAYLAANPLPLPEKTGYWYLASADTGQGWLMQRWGSRAYVGGLAYDAAGRPAWYVGLCVLSGTTCSGTLSSLANGAAFGAAGGAVPSATPVAVFTLVTAADGRTTSLRIGDAAAQSLTMFPIGGAATTGFAGLPQAGWWYEPASVGGNGYFIAVHTQPQADGSVRQMAYVTVLTFDAAGRAVWYSAQGALGADLGFSGLLMQYAGGAPLGQTQAGATGAMAAGQFRILFNGSDKARISLPNGRVADIVPNRF